MPYLLTFLRRLPASMMLAIASAVLFAFPTSGLAQSTVFVKAGAPAGGNGLTWGTAFNDLYAAINYARSNGVAEIWIAAGTYRGLGANGPFLIPAGCSFIGGFAGGETLVSQRNIAANQTILSGDVNGNSQPDGSGTADDLGIVVVNDSTTTNKPVLDGVTVEYGRSAGVLFSGMAAGSTPRVTHCTIRNIFAPTGQNAVGILQSGGAPLGVYDHNTIYNLVGGGGNSGANGSAGSNGPAGGTNGTSGNGDPGSPGGAGGAGTSGGSGGRATAIEVQTGGHARIFANRIASLRGGTGGVGAQGGDGGAGGTGGSPATPGPHDGGSGGNGGNGGTGGLGGKGGDAIGILYDHTAAGAPAIAMNTVSGLRPGQGGVGGRGGNGGAGGNGAGADRVRRA